MGVQYHKADPVGLEFQFRSLPDGGDQFVGYAAVFGRPSKLIRDELARGRPYRETLLPGSFQRTLGDGKRTTFVVDHNERLLVSSAPRGQLRLAEDSKGLHVESPWPSTHYTDSVRALYDAGEQLGMSILFGTMRNGDAWSTDGSQRTVSEAVLKHVTVLATMEPAYDGTVASFRALADMTEATPEDVESLVDALREGRRLDDSEFHLLNRLTEAVKPEPAPAPAEAAPVIPAGVMAVLAKLDAEFPQT